jgi:hypothetical protein
MRDGKEIMMGDIYAGGEKGDVRGRQKEAATSMVARLTP